jgi:two-component system nitrogen regulation response regulator GlnG
MSKNNDKSLTHIFEDRLDAYFAAHEGELPKGGLYKRLVEDMERSLIKKTLDATRGNQLKAAEVLGINRNTLSRKMQILGIKDPRKKS